MKRLLAASLLALLASSSTAAIAASHENFAPCGDASADPQLAGSLCAELRLPFDRRLPTGEKISLFLRDFPAAAPSRGQVWLLTGESGAALYPLIGTLRQAFPGYDLILPDRRGTGRSPAPAGRITASATSAAYDLQAELDRYAGSGAVLLYGTAKGSDVALKALSLVRPHRIEAVILDRPVAPLSATGPSGGTIQAPEADQDGQPLELGLPTSLPRTLILQSDSDPALLGELDKESPVTAYQLDGAPGFLMMTLPECAAPLVRGFVEGTGEGAPCAARLELHF